MSLSKVAVLKTLPQTVLADVEHLMSMADFEQALPRDRVTILKDNISWHFPYLSANTTPWQLEGTIRALRNAGYESIVAVHNKTVVTNPRKGGILNRLAPVYARYGIEEKYNSRPEDVRWIEYKPKTRMRVLHEVYPEGIHIPEYFIDKNIIHLPTVKTHIYTTTTGAMKNAFGGLLNTKRHYTHSVIHETLVDLLAIQQEIHTGIFAVMDGTLCGNGPGPRTMIPVEKDYILAGSDSVAIDAVAAKMMGFDPMSIPYIRLAHEDGLGIGRPQEIEIVGEDVSEVNFGFRVGDNFASRFGDALWFSPLKALQRLFFRTPAVYFFIFGSYFYHDFLWWPIKGKSAQRTHALNTKWGELFKSYPAEPDHLGDARVRPQEELLRT
ncbi:MAG: iron-sulfur cluster-binding protein [Planctomycetes bacterium RBG_13_60_9]|nr:MAG: iron-sulfur cluster-binding protein [Planctomycetes bacterium RBG_13_60_9]